jgi:hypothetical protein
MTLVSSCKDDVVPCLLILHECPGEERALDLLKLSSDNVVFDV